MRTAAPQESTNGSRDKLTADLRSLLTDAEELLRVSSGYSGEGFTEARSRFEERLKQLKKKLSETESFVQRYRQVAVEAATSTDRYVRDNPWQIIGVSAAVGALIGFLIGHGQSQR